MASLGLINGSHRSRKSPRRHPPAVPSHVRYRRLRCDDSLRAAGYARSMRQPEQRIGQLLGGRYRLQELLAVGGMGLVYAATHEATGRSVAIKLLRSELLTQPDLVRRVSAEARLAVEASHPNVVEVLDAGAD